MDSKCGKTKKNKQSEVTEEDVEIELIMVKIDQIDFNIDNPNVHDQKTFDMLKENIKNFGYIEPGVVVKDGDRFFVVDGHHRVIAMKEMGYTEIPLIHAKNLPKSAAYVGAFIFNKIRGTVDPQKVAKLLTNAYSNYGENELRKFGQLSKEKMSEFVEMEKLKGHETAKLAVKESVKITELADNTIKTEIKELKSKKPEELTRVIVLSLKQPQHEFIMKVLNEYDQKPEVALLMVCEEISGESFTS